MLQKFGDRGALFFKGKRWSFADLDQIINRAAKGLLQMGVQKRDKIAL